MDSVTVSDRDKKIIIWNFMEELLGEPSERCKK